MAAMVGRALKLGRWRRTAFRLLPELASREGASVGSTPPTGRSSLHTVAPSLLHGGRNSLGLAPEGDRYSLGQKRWITSDLSELPTVHDQKIAKALNLLVAHPWLEIEDEVRDEVEKALATSSDEEGKKTLQSAWSAAQAAETFGEKMEHLRMELDELSGGKFGGEAVANIPEPLRNALKSSLERYFNYLAAFDADEIWLKKKVEVELGGSLLTVKQRCSGLESEWGKVSLLGTSGLSGSYIERRAGLQN